MQASVRVLRAISVGAVQVLARCSLSRTSLYYSTNVGLCSPRVFEDKVHYGTSAGISTCDTGALALLVLFELYE